jgi:hypothetical protein
MAQFYRTYLHCAHPYKAAINRCHKHKTQNPEKTLNLKLV